MLLWPEWELRRSSICWHLLWDRATPVAEIISLLVAAVMVVPYIRKLARGQEI